MKKHYLAILVTMFLSITGTMLGNTELPAPSSHIVNLIPTKYQSSEHLRLFFPSMYLYHTCPPLNKSSRNLKESIKITPSEIRSPRRS